MQTLKGYIFLGGYGLWKLCHGTGSDCAGWLLAHQLNQHVRKMDKLVQLLSKEQTVENSEILRRTAFCIILHYQSWLRMEGYGTWKIHPCNKTDISLEVIIFWQTVRGLSKCQKYSKFKFVRQNAVFAPNIYGCSIDLWTRRFKFQSYHIVLSVWAM